SRGRRRTDAFGSIARAPDYRPPAVGTPVDARAEAAPATADLGGAQRRAVSIIDNERWLGALLIGPAILYIVLLVGLPFFMALYYSVSNTTTGGGTLGFVGLRNFTGVIGTPKFQTALKNTLIFALLSQVV